MANPLWSFLTGRGAESQANVSTMTMDELDKYDVIAVEDTPGKQFAVVAPRAKSMPMGREFGSSSPSPWTSFQRQEYNPALQGVSGFAVYDKMRKGDGTVRGTLRSIKMGALSGRYFIEPASDSEQDKEIADFIWCNLTDLMSIPFHQVLFEALLMCDFGYYCFEKVWDNVMYKGQLRTVLTKLGPRHPMDIKQWRFDANGGPKQAVFYRTEAQVGEVDDIAVDIEKLLVFTFDREAGNIEGISVLRSAYKHWYYKEQLYKIDAIQKERHGIGIPIIKLPMGYTPADKVAAEELGRNVRTNERAHIVLPPGWEMAMLKLEGQPVDAMKSIEHHNGAIRENILVNFIGDHAKQDDLVMFFKASRFVADIFTDTINTYLIPQMVRYNWLGVEKMPKLRVRRIGESADWRTLSFALRNLVGAGLIIPDESLEINLREEMDLTPIDKDTARLIATPQNPFDVNEDALNMDPTDPNNPANQDIPKVSQKGSVSDDRLTIHNRNNPRYNRRPRGKKQKGMVAGLPRQSLPQNQHGVHGVGGSQGGGDRSGG